MGPKPSIDPERTPVVRKITSHLDKRLLVPCLAVLAPPFAVRLDAVLAHQFWDRPKPPTVGALLQSCIGAFEIRASRGIP